MSIQKKIDNGLIQIYYGNGKGKTTAALGTSIRGLGHGKKIHWIQYMKAGINQGKTYETTGEISMLMKHKGFSIERYGSGEWAQNSIEETKKEFRKGIDAIEKIKEKNCDILVLDEILYGWQMELITEDEIIQKIKELQKIKPQMEIILTGSHNAPEKIIKIADLTTEIKKIKHPYDKGIKARKGIEF